MFSRKFRLKIVIFTTSLMFFGELIFGYLTNSIALITDSFHMLSDIAALCIAHYAITLTERKKYDENYTFGWQRAETLGALVNSVFLLALCFTIFLSAIERFFQPVPITQPMVVLIVGSAGLAVNLVSLALFHDVHHEHVPPPVTNIPEVADMEAGTATTTQTHAHHHHRAGSLNMRGAFLHVMGDALGSVGVIISAVVIKWSGWSKSYYMDPAASVVIAGIIVCTTWKLFRRTSDILLHVVPPSISIGSIKQDIVALANVKDIHEFHVWQLSDWKTIASVHVILNSNVNEQSYMEISNHIKKILHAHKIHSTTVQIEVQDDERRTADREDDTTSGEILDNCLVTCEDTSCQTMTCCPKL